MLVAAFETNGGQDPKVPDPEQPDIRRVEQVPEDERGGERASGACSLFPATRVRTLMGTNSNLTITSQYFSSSTHHQP